MSAFPSLDEFEGGVTEARPSSGRGTTVEDGGNEIDMSGQSFPEIGDSGDLFDQENSFQRSFPSLGAGQSQNQHGMISAPTGPYIPGAATSGAQVTDTFAKADADAGGEPEVIRAWRERQQVQIERRDAVSAKKKEETVAKARQAIDDFYDNYNAKRDKEIAKVRKEQEDFLAKRDETQSGGTTWERIAKLIDAKDKSAAAYGGRDVSRMRDLLLNLRKDANAPSAGL